MSLGYLCSVEMNRRKAGAHPSVPPLVFLQNDVWGLSIEIPYWCVTTQIWVVLLTMVSLTECGRICSHWLKQISQSNMQIWVVTRYQYETSALVPLTSFYGKTSDGIAKCLLFSQLIKKCSSNNRFPTWKTFGHVVHSQFFLSNQPQ